MALNTPPGFLVNNGRKYFRLYERFLGWTFLSPYESVYWVLLSALGGTFMQETLTLAWKKPSPPTVPAWMNLVNSTIPLYNYDRGCSKKFDKVGNKLPKYNYTANMTGAPQ